LNAWTSALDASELGNYHRKEEIMRHGQNN